jgi:hypothetical protein
MSGGAIPTELYSNLVLATGSFYNASRALPGTMSVYSILPAAQQIQAIQFLVNKVQPVAESRVSADLYFRSRFRRKLFDASVDDGRAVLDMSTQCTNERDFVSKVQALASFATRFDSRLKDMIADQITRDRIDGSTNVLETILAEKFGTYDPEIISGLRKINTLRSQMYPTHGTTPRAIEVLEQMGYHYPPHNWNQVWETVLDICNNSLKKLAELLANP